MNIASSIRKLKVTSIEWTGRQKLLVLSFILLVVLIMTIYVNSAEVVVDQRTLNSTVPNITQSISRTEKQSSQTLTASVPLDNPFALPPKNHTENSELEYEVKSLVIPSSRSSEISNSVPQNTDYSSVAEKFKLTGLITGVDKCFAVIRFANKSQAYCVNEWIDAYRVKTINHDHVILVNADHDVLLPLEPMTPLSANHREK